MTDLVSLYLMRYFVINYEHELFQFTLANVNTETCWSNSKPVIKMFSLCKYRTFSPSVLPFRLALRNTESFTGLHTHQGLLYYIRASSVLQSQVKVKVKVTLRLTVSQPLCLSVEPNLGILTRDFFFFKFTVLSYLGRPLWREVGSVMCQSSSLKSTVVSHYLQNICI
jgi:hypothetical protein